MKTAIGAAAVGLLALGGVAIATSRASRPQTYEPAQTATVAPAPAGAPATLYTANLNTASTEPKVEPVAATATTTRTEVAPVRTRTVYRTRSPRYLRHTRSTKHSIAIIGGSTVGGALVGGLVGGKKGAVIGGLVGGGAGTVYDRKTRHKVKRVQ